MDSALSSATDTGGSAGGASGVEHIVLLKVKDDATDDQTRAMIDGVNALIGIDGVISVSIGKIFVDGDWMADRTRGHNYALRVRLENREALRRYQDDEGHQKLLKGTIAPILSELPPTAVDFESPLVM